MTRWLRASAVIGLIAWHSPTHHASMPEQALSAATALQRAAQEQAMAAARQALAHPLAASAARTAANLVVDRAAPRLDPAWRSKVADAGADAFLAKGAEALSPLARPAPLAARR